MENEKRVAVSEDDLELAAAEAKLLREELRKAAKNAGVADPGRFVDQFLPMTRFVYGKPTIQLGKEKLTVRQVASRIKKQNTTAARVFEGEEGDLTQR